MGTGVYGLEPEAALEADAEVAAEVGADGKTVAGLKRVGGAGFLKMKPSEEGGWDDGGLEPAEADVTDEEDETGLAEGFTPNRTSVDAVLLVSLMKQGHS